MSLLLERTRKINKLLQKSEKVDYGEMAAVLCNVMGSNVYIISKEGVALGFSLLGDRECEVLREKVLSQGRFPEHYVEWLLKIHEIAPNLHLGNQLCAFGNEMCKFQDKYNSFIPIYGGGERIGTLIISKFAAEFNDEDLILAEYGAAVVGIQILHDRSNKSGEEARKKVTVQVALGTLSYSELEAIMHILDELEGSEGLLVASKIADRVGITRSVIVNALRKFESAGVIESKSLGMKGTYIKVLNNHLYEELNKIR